MLSQAFTPMDTEQVRAALNWRYAVKKFDSSKKISPPLWQTIEDALLLCPSSYGLQPWQFILVETQDLREKLKPHSWNQSQVTDASHYLVLCFKRKMDEAHIKKFIQQTIKVRELTDSLKGYQDMMIKDLVEGPRSAVINTWASRQVYIAMGFAMETAALLGIDTCPLEGLDPVKYDEILGLTNSEYQSVAAIAFGYRHAEDKYQFNKKVRFEKNEVFKTL